MRLPKSLWKLLRSKWLHRALIIAPSALTAGIAIFYWSANHRGQKRFDATAEEFRKLGIPTSHEEFLKQATTPERSIIALIDGLPLTSADIDPFGLLGIDYPKPSDLLQTDASGVLITRVTDFFPVDRWNESPSSLAKELLATLDPLSLKIEPIAVALHDPRYGFPPQIDESIEPSSILTRTIRFLVFRAKLRAIAGDIDGAMSDIIGPTAFIQRAQLNVDSLLEAVHIHGLMISIKDTVQALSYNQSIDEPQLAILAEALQKIDQPACGIRTFERDLWMFFDALGTDHHSATATSFKHVRWHINWNHSWGDWTDTFGSWWRQLRPAGHLKSDFCREANLMLATLTRDSKGRPRTSISYREIRDAEVAYESRFKKGRLDSGFIRWIYSNSVLQAMMLNHLDLRTTRLLVACERYRLKHGRPPSTIESLIPEFLQAPLICPLSEKPLEIIPEPDGRIKLSADGTSPADPVFLLFPAKSRP